MCSRDVIFELRSVRCELSAQVRSTVERAGCGRTCRGRRAGKHVKARRHCIAYSETSDGEFPVLSTTCRRHSNSLDGYEVDINAVITETHLKSKHADHNFGIQNYTLFRRDRSGRRGGGVAVYVSNRLSADVWSCPCDSAQFELLWTRVLSHGRYMFVGGIHHPPKPLYRTPALLDCIEASVDALTVEYPNATVVLAGDFNGLDDAELSTRSMLTSIVNQPTRGTNVLDKIYVNDTSYDAGILQNFCS